MRIHTTYIQTGLDLRCSQLKKSKLNALTRLHDSQSGLFICNCHIPNTDGVVLSMLSLTSSVICITAWGDRTGRVTADRTLKHLRC